MAALIQWKLSGGATPNAQGIRITRIAQDGTRTVLASPTPFPGQTGSSQPSDVWPIQKREGRYYDFEPGLGEYKYEVALMVGQPGALTASPTVVATSKTVRCTFKVSQFIKAGFNWGILSTQKISRWIEANCGQGTLAALVKAEADARAALKAARQSPTGTPAAGTGTTGGATAHVLSTTSLVKSALSAGFTPDKYADLHNEAHTEAFLADPSNGKLAPLSTAVKTPGNEIREELAAGVIDFLMGMVRTAAKSNGFIYDLSYELTDEEWIDLLVSNSKLLSIIIASIGTENAAATQRLQASAAKVFVRLLKNKYGIAHNKVQIRTDSKRVPKEVASGACNKTPSGFCGQVTNVIRILSDVLAAQFMGYYNAILADTQAGSAQGAALRQFCNKFQDKVTLSDGTTIQVIFAPNNLTEEKPAEGLTPGMGYLSSIIDQLDDGDIAVGNCFIPGHIGLPDLLAQAKIKKPGIIMKVAVSDKSALPATQPPVADGEDPVFVVAQAIRQPFANLLPEILGLPGAHAFIHSKTLVIYLAKTKQWIVVTGSHNLGEKADDVNDDHFMAIMNCILLGLAYFVNNLSVYDHFLFRYKVNYGQAGTGYLDTTGAWQTVSADQETEIDAIMNALASLDDATPVTDPDDPEDLPQTGGSNGSEGDQTTDKSGKTGGKNPRPAPGKGRKPSCKTTSSKSKGKGTGKGKGKAEKAKTKTAPKPSRKTTPKKPKSCPKTKKPSRKTTPRRTK
jgi:hypothetical protein